jgi:pimeloyl-ACP methyl ester carboxylesterase
VVIPGLHSGINYLSDMTENLQRTHYVCVYDRPGNELSPYRSGRLTLTAQDHARELAALLTAVGVTGPVVLVPHSYPGLIAQAFWQAFPERVAGIILLDTPPPGMGIGSMWSESNTSVDITASQKLIAKGPRMGAVPLMIVSSGAGGVDTPETPARALDKFSNNVEHILLPGAPHEMWHEYMPAVVAATRVLVNSATTGQPLPACAPAKKAWATVGALCF